MSTLAAANSHWKQNIFCSYVFPFKMSLQFVYSGCSQLTLRKQGYLAPLCILTLRTRKYHSRMFNLNMSLQFDCSSCSKFTLKTRISNYFFVFNFNVFFLRLLSQATGYLHSGQGYILTWLLNLTASVAANYIENKDIMLLHVFYEFKFSVSEITAYSLLHVKF